MADGRFKPAPPERLSDLKPVTATIELARLAHPPLYHPHWRHHVDLRITSVDARWSWCVTRPG